MRILSRNSPSDKPGTAQNEFLGAWDQTHPDSRTAALPRRFWVSSLVILRRAHELGRLSTPVFHELVEQERQKIHRGRRASGGDFYRTLVVRMGGRFTYTVVATPPTDGHAGGPEVGARGVAVHLGLGRDAPQRPSQSAQCDDLLLFRVTQDINHPDGGPCPSRRSQCLGRLAVVAGFQVSINGRFWVSTEGGVCGAKINGQYRGFEGFRAMTEPPAHCHECGRPYPWTVEKIESAKALAAELEGLSEPDRIAIGATIEDLVVESPRTPVAVIRFKKLIARASGPARAFLLDLMAKIAVESARAGLG